MGRKITDRIRGHRSVRRMLEAEDIRKRLRCKNGRKPMIGCRPLARFDLYVLGRVLLMRGRNVGVGGQRWRDRLGDFRVYTRQRRFQCDLQHLVHGLDEV
jgi:hypothetical protein